MLVNRAVLNVAAANRLHQQLDKNIVAMQRRTRQAAEANAISRAAGTMISLSKHMWQMFKEGAAKPQTHALPAPKTKNGKK